MSNYYNTETLLEQQTEIEKLKAERDALAAQAQALKTAAKFILDAKKPETKRKAYAALADAVGKTPQQHLAEIRAEAGRSGFVAGYLLCNDGSPIIKHNYEGFADKYANQVRQGEVE